MNIDGLTTLFTAGVFFLAIAFGLFMMLRYIILWYFRIDEIVELLKKQTELLETIAKTESPAPPVAPVATPRPNPLTRK